MTIKEKFLNKEEFTSDEVEQVICEGAEDVKQIETLEGEDRRWSRTDIIVFKVNDRYFELEYEHGLTECQENEYYCQKPIEVKKVERVVKITDWEVIK